jgi:hypothetical protein
MDTYDTSAWMQYGGLAILVIAIGYLIFWSLTPSRIQAQLKAAPKFKAYEEVTKLAPLGCPVTGDFKLCDYYIASSSFSIFPGAEIYDYVSDEIIPMVVKAGARLIELDVYADEAGNPVVGLKNQKLGTDYAYNTVPFQQCCINISNNAFNSVFTPVSSDPFFLSLVFHTNKTNVINACSEIIKTTCRRHLLDEKYGYQNKNIAVEPVCNLQNKLVIISGGPVKGTKMEELVNLSWDTSNCRRLTYTQASQTHDADELINFNRSHVTIVVPDIGNDLKNNNPLGFLDIRKGMLTLGLPTNY